MRRSEERGRLQSIGLKRVRHNAVTEQQSAAKKKKKKKNTPLGVELREHLYTAGGNVSWYSHYGKQYGGSSKS